MSGEIAALVHNARWEVTRLCRSRRIWLLLIPIIAGPIGSGIADLYLHVPSSGTAEVLGLLITAGLAALVVLDLTALAVGEDLALRTHYLTFALPQPRASALAGRLLVVVGGTLAVYGVGAAAVAGLAGTLVSTSSTAPTPILVPAHLAIGVVGLLVFLSGVTAAAGVVTRSASQALVAGILAGVVAAGIGSMFLIEGRLTALFPEVLAAAGLVGFAWCLTQYGRIEG
jgi:ABC-type transport system involved in multi-copper enzyme maturation permease subunit